MSCKLLFYILKVAGVAGFEPTNGGIKTRCLTTWRHPTIKTNPRLVRDLRRNARSGETFIPRATMPRHGAGTLVTMSCASFRLAQGAKMHDPVPVSRAGAKCPSQSSALRDFRVARTHHRLEIIPPARL